MHKIRKTLGGLGPSGREVRAREEAAAAAGKSWSAYGYSGSNAGFTDIFSSNETWSKDVERARRESFASGASPEKANDTENSYSGNSGGYQNQTQSASAPHPSSKSHHTRPHPHPPHPASKPNYNYNYSNYPYYNYPPSYGYSSAPAPTQNQGSAQIGVIPMRSAAFQAPRVPLPKLCGHLLDENEDDDDPENNPEGLQFQFKPQTRCRTEVTFTIEPKPQPPWLTMLNCGFKPMVNCSAPPCYLSQNGNPGMSFSGGMQSFVNRSFGTQVNYGGLANYPTIEQLQQSFPYAKVVDQGEVPDEVEVKRMGQYDPATGQINPYQYEDQSDPNARHHHHRHHHQRKLEKSPVKSQESYGKLQSPKRISKESPKAKVAVVAREVKVQKQPSPVKQEETTPTPAVAPPPAPTQEVTVDLDDDDNDSLPDLKVDEESPPSQGTSADTEETSSSGSNISEGLIQQLKEKMKLRESLAHELVTKSKGIPHDQPHQDHPAQPVHHDHGAGHQGHHSHVEGHHGHQDHQDHSHHHNEQDHQKLRHRLKHHRDSSDSSPRSILSRSSDWHN